MTSSDDSRDRLVALAGDFASELTDITESVLPPGSSSHFDWLGVEGKDGQDFRVVVRQDADEGIGLRVAGEVRLQLKVSFNCSWNERQTHLSVVEGRFEARCAGVSEPLFRYEYRRDAYAEPCAHLQVHAHRDEVVYLALAGGSSRQARERERQLQDGVKPTKLVSLRDLRFPLGGHRLRPAYEDVLEMLIHEFGIEVAPDAEAALAASRATWRKRQIAVAVTDSPESAASQLRDLGYRVESPPQGPLEDRSDRLRAW